LIETFDYVKLWIDELFGNITEVLLLCAGKNRDEILKFDVITKNVAF